MLSVVIPTHHSRHLAETIASVLDQTEPEFEILIVPNGGASLDGVLPDDARIRVVPYEGPSVLGAIKRFAFDAARGDILVALDHDDLLAPQALQRVRETMAAGADFAYSNFAELDFERGESIVHDSYWGWASRTAEIRGRSVAEMIAFDPAPAALGRACYAPNHLRAWTRDAYARAGGHNPTMAVCEDHDLVVRTYLTGQMMRIDECLYIQRDHPGRMPLASNTDVQKASEEMYGRSVDSLVVRWAALHRLPCFDLAGGHNNAPGWVTTDLNGTRIAADLRGRWPWAGLDRRGVSRAGSVRTPRQAAHDERTASVFVPNGWIPVVDAFGAWPGRLYGSETLQLLGPQLVLLLGRRRIRARHRQYVDPLPGPAAGRVVSNRMARRATDSLCLLRWRLLEGRIRRAGSPPDLKRRS